jgi:hypothetical protein
MPHPDNSPTKEEIAEEIKDNKKMLEYLNNNYSAA